MMSQTLGVSNSFPTSGETRVPSLKLTAKPLKMVVSNRSLWDSRGLCSEAMLVSGRVRIFMLLGIPGLSTLTLHNLHFSILPVPFFDLFVFGLVAGHWSGWVCRVREEQRKPLPTSSWKLPLPVCISMISSAVHLSQGIYWENHRTLLNCLIHLQFITFLKRESYRVDLTFVPIWSRPRSVAHLNPSFHDDNQGKKWQGLPCKVLFRPGLGPEISQWTMIVMRNNKPQ